MIHAPRTWLVAHDFSPCGAAAATVALAELLAMEPGGTILLLHVLQPPPIVAGPEEALPVHTAAIAEAASHDAERALARIAEALAKKAGDRVAIEAIVEVGASPPATILEVARVRDVERIIVGTHGRRGLPRMLLGSVAELVVRRAEVPVLVVHAATEERAAAPPGG